MLLDTSVVSGMLDTPPSKDEVIALLPGQMSHLSQTDHLQNQHAILVFQCKDRTR